MSHIVQIQTEVRDVAAIQAACCRLKLPTPAFGLYKLFTRRVEGWGVRLAGWLYPIVCQPHSGTLQFDNYGGKWGEQTQLDRFLQGYAVEKSILEPRKKGFGVNEQTLADGSIKLVVQMGGAV